LKLAAQIPLRPRTTDQGKFAIPHGLSSTPKIVIIQMTSAGLIWWQDPVRFDEKNLYLVTSGAADDGVTGIAEVLE
jgi:hypothetical protein